MASNVLSKSAREAAVADGRQAYKNTNYGDKLPTAEGYAAGHGYVGAAFEEAKVAFQAGVNQEASRPRFGLGWLIGLAVLIFAITFLVCLGLSNG